MKQTAFAILIILISMHAYGQRKKVAPVAYPKHSLFADVGTAPGLSITYNYKKVKWFSIGGGFHAYKLRNIPSDSKHLIPGVFGDARFNIRPEKNNQFFTFINLGIDIYKKENKYYRDSISLYRRIHNNGLNIGLGAGYLRRMTKRGGGPYASLKILTDWYRLDRYSILSNEDDTKIWSAGGSFVFSLGFKF